MKSKETSKELKKLRKVMADQERIVRRIENREVNILVLEVLEAFEKRLDKLEK